MPETQEPQAGESVEDLKHAAVAALDSADSSEQLEAWRVQFTGRKGRLTSLLRGLGSLDMEDRKVVGAAANRLRGELESLYEDRERQSKSSQAPVGSIDVSLPGRKPALGGLHPSTQMIREITQAFNEMGFQAIEGPEVELEKYNFDMLNIPADHPARDQWDTIWVDSDKRDDVLLRTHTSPVQARVIESTEPPIRVVVPGKCYRYESTDATHEWHFNQIEGLAVDEGITLADLKGTLYEFARRVLGLNGRLDSVATTSRLLNPVLICRSTGMAVGWRSWVREWFTRRFLSTLDTIRASTRVLLSVWGQSGFQCCETRSLIFDTSSRTTFAF